MIYSGSHSSIYFLIILMYSNLVGHAVNSNLYSEFNNGLDKISNYAENRVKEETSPTLEEFYNHNEDILWKHLQNIPLENVWNANKFSENAGIEKLINALSPYHEPFQSTDFSSYLASRNSGMKAYKRGVQRSPVKYEPVDKRNFLLSGGKWSKRSEKSVSDELALMQRLKSKRIEREKRLDMPSKRYDSGYQMPDPKSLLNTAPSIYPSVLASSLDVSAPSNSQGLPLKAANLNVPAENIDLSNSLNQIKAIQNALFTSQQQSQSPQPSSDSSVPLRYPIGVNDIISRSATVQQYQPVPAPAGAAAVAAPGAAAVADPGAAAVPAPRAAAVAAPGAVGDSNALDADNIKNVLEKVISELESFRQCKGNANNNSNTTPEGTPCNVMGSWNSEIVGLRFDVSASESKGVNVDVQERCPVKRHAWMDPDWLCMGGALKKIGGPLYIIAEKPEENTLATFTGLCKVCGGTDTIFGTWSIVHPAKDCQDLQLAIETKRDVFRRDLLPQKKRERLELIKKLNARSGSGDGCRKSKKPCDENLLRK